MRVAATTAVMAGTAGAVRHRQEQKYAGQQADQQAAYDQQEMQQQLAMQQQQIQQMQSQAAPPQVAAAAPTADDKFAKLEKLGQLKAAGILTEEEFAAQKAVILAS